MVFSSNFVEFLDYQDFDARISVNGFSIESSSTTSRLLIENLIHELKPGFDEKIQFQQ